MLNSLGVLAIIPATVLLTFSFFVLFAIRKLEVGDLKVFGKVLVILLWVGAALILLTVISPRLTGPCSMDKMQMHKMHKMMKGDMARPMMPGRAPSDTMAQ
jgi:hypothetical protein